MLKICQGYSIPTYSLTGFDASDGPICHDLNLVVEITVVERTPGSLAYTDILDRLKAKIWPLLEATYRHSILVHSDDKLAAKMADRIGFPRPMHVYRHPSHAMEFARSIYADIVLPRAKELGVFPTAIQVRYGVLGVGRCSVPEDADVGELMALPARVLLKQMVIEPMSDLDRPSARVSPKCARAFSAYS